ncbi:hypothetical protein MTO96_014446 [Rhipicephalus appendiculatus]
MKEVPGRSQTMDGSRRLLVFKEPDDAFASSTSKILEALSFLRFFRLVRFFYVFVEIIGAPRVMEVLQEGADD